MKSVKIFAAALMLVFALSLTASQACDKTQAKNTSGKECSTVKTTASNSECTMKKDAAGKEVKAECSETMKKTSGSCPSSCTGKATKLEAKNNLKSTTTTKEKTVAVTPVSK